MRNLEIWFINFRAKKNWKYELPAGLKFDMECEKINIPCEYEDSMKIFVAKKLERDYCTNKYENGKQTKTENLFSFLNRLHS